MVLLCKHHAISNDGVPSLRRSGLQHLGYFPRSGGITLAMKRGGNQPADAPALLTSVLTRFDQQLWAAAGLGGKQL